MEKDEEEEENEEEGEDLSIVSLDHPTFDLGLTPKKKARRKVSKVRKRRYQPKINATKKQKGGTEKNSSDIDESFKFYIPFQEWIVAARFDDNPEPPLVHFKSTEDNKDWQFYTDSLFADPDPMASTDKVPLPDKEFY